MSMTIPATPRDEICDRKEDRIKGYHSEPQHTLRKTQTAHVARRDFVTPDHLHMNSEGYYDGLSELHFNGEQPTHQESINVLQHAPVLWGLRMPSNVVQCHNGTFQDNWIKIIIGWNKYADHRILSSYLPYEIRRKASVRRVFQSDFILCYRLILRRRWNIE